VLFRSRFNPKDWLRHQFRLVLWCEHSRLPLPVLNNEDMKKGVYDLELEQEWFKKAAPYLKFAASTLSMVLPVASSALKVVNDAAFKSLQDQIGLGKDIIDAIAGEGTAINEFMGAVDTTELKQGVSVRGDGATLREFHALLKAKDPSNNFGGLVRVMNKRQEFMWVHERFAGEY
jgi:internalin A